jgi:hypothetical protein
VKWKRISINSSVLPPPMRTLNRKVNVVLTTGSNMPHQAVPLASSVMSSIRNVTERILVPEGQAEGRLTVAETGIGKGSPITGDAVGPTREAVQEIDIESLPLLGKIGINLPPQAITANRTVLGKIQVVVERVHSVQAKYWQNILAQNPSILIRRSV